MLILRLCEGHRRCTRGIVVKDNLVCHGRRLRLRFKPWRETMEFETLLDDMANSVTMLTNQMFPFDKGLGGVRGIGFDRESMVVVARVW